jgi:signal transduction histidine kinase/DNA-binding response OmpR family regulator
VAQRRPGVLIVDDRPEQRFSLSAVVQDLTDDVVTAASGADALRWLLKREFAVILLDVNMPDCDGFETAALIRQRRSSRTTPIIFVTSHGDEDRAARGYSLGAVDYIFAPVEPQVLRSKISVFLELYAKTEEVRHQAASLRGHAEQLRRLAAAATEIHRAASIDDLVKTVADTAASILGAGQVAVEIDPERLADAPPAGRGHGRGGFWRPERTSLAALAKGALQNLEPRPMRFSRSELDEDPRWGPAEPSPEFLPLQGWLAAPLCRSDGRLLGWIQLSDKQGGEFTAEDEVVLVQLAQMAAISAENTQVAEVREANRLKDEFLATLSHELRTPLQSILTWSQLLREEGPGDASVQRGLDVIERNARAQTRLIEDLLDVSRIISGKLALEKRALRLGEIVAAAVEDAAPAAREKQIEIAIEARSDPWLTGDPHRLRQVVGNLLSNAIKFTHERGFVTVGLESGDGEAEVAVRDTGRGIDQQFLPHLFERFRQEDSGTTRSHGGLGIGLAIARHLTELHGGSIRAESGGEGCGATFTLRFPVGLAAHVAREETPSASGTDLGGVRILLVEDEADTRDGLTLVLTKQGASVEAVGSVREALEALDRELPDVLLSDLALPGEDGFSLIRRIRTRSPEAGGRIPAAALSAYVRPEERARAILAGFDRHLPKPIEPAELAAALRELVARRD